MSSEVPAISIILLSVTNVLIFTVWPVAFWQVPVSQVERLRERFPEAQKVLAEDFDQAMAKLTPSESSYIVIVTRGHRDDMRCLRWAVQTQARYIGMIGSKRKTVAIYKELVKEGVASDLFKRVHAPVGLDIGAVTPEEIAVSITAELIALRRHAERPQPHMSWFLSHELEGETPAKKDLMDSPAELE